MKFRDGKFSEFKGKKMLKWKEISTKLKISMEKINIVF